MATNPFLNLLRSIPMRFGPISARLRSFVLGSAVVQTHERTWGHDTPYTPEVFGEYIARSNTVYACATIRAQMLASLPLRLYQKQTNGKPVEITAGEAYDLLSRVNPHWTWNRLIQQTELSLCLWGKANWFLERGEKANQPPSEIWWGKPSRVTVVPHEVDYIEKFIYEPLVASKPLEYLPQEVVWFRFPNPLDEFDGLSPIAAARLAADTNQMAMLSNYNLFKNGLNMGGLLMPKPGNEITKDQAIDIEKMLERRFKGVDKAHRWGVLTFEAAVNSMGVTPKDAEFSGLISLTLEEICRAYKVPLDLIGGQRTYANVESSRLLLWEECLIPEVQFLEAELREQLLPMFGADDVFAKFDLDQVPVLQAAKAAQWTRAREQIMANALTINDWRKEQGLDPYAWGDHPYDELKSMFSGFGFGGGGSMGGDAPAELPPGDGEPVEPIPAKGETEAEPVRLIGNITVIKPLRLQLEGPHKTRVVAGPAYGSPEHRAVLDRFNMRVASKEKKLGEVVAEMMRRQQDAVLAALRGRTARAASTVYENPFNKPEWIKKFREAIRPALRDIVGSAGQSGLEDISASVDFKLTDPNVVKFIESRAQRFAVQVNDTTWNKLRDTLSEGYQAGEGVDKLAERVDATMTLRIGQSAEVIARTEVIGGENGGMLLGWQQSDIVKGKTWLATMGDDRTRETHVEAHGQTVGLDEDFEVGDGAGPAPGQIGLGEEDIQCRCTMMAVVK